MHILLQEGFSFPLVYISKETQFYIKLNSLKKMVKKNKIFFFQNQKTKGHFFSKDIYSTFATSLNFATMFRKKCNRGKNVLISLVVFFIKNMQGCIWFKSKVKLSTAVFVIGQNHTSIKYN